MASTISSLVGCMANVRSEQRSSAWNTLSKQSYILSALAYSNTTAEWAAQCGHLHILEYLHSFGYDLVMDQIYLGAVKSGHIHILEWVKSHHSLATQDWFSVAVRNPRVVKWLSVQPEYKWCLTHVLILVSVGDVTMLKWVIEGTKTARDYIRMYRNIFHHVGCVEMLEYLCEIRPPNSTEVEFMMGGVDKKIVEWLTLHGYA